MRRAQKQKIIKQTQAENSKQLLLEPLKKNKLLFFGYIFRTRYTNFKRYLRKRATKG